MFTPPPFPLGTITFLFTDVEGSTRRWEEDSDAMAAALARHDLLVRRAIEENNGRIFQTVGDGFCAAFATASDALKAALSCHLSLLDSGGEHHQPDSLRIRIALHTGEARERDGNYFGPALNRVARLLATGSGQQTLLSQTTCGLVRDDLPPSTTLVDLGMHRLRDLQRAEHVFQIVHRDLPSEFPPLKSLNNADLPNNLPQQVTSFIGREKEMAGVLSLMERTRLLTLVGSGGAGKTRLSLQAAAELINPERTSDGVWFIELAPLGDGGLVSQTVAGVLGVREQPNATLTETLIEWLKTRRLLLVLDNCEHLVEACARFADAVLKNCPQVSILASSREALGIAGEQVYRVPSLSLPATAQQETPESLSQYEAVRLFIDRAQSVQPSFHVTNANAPALAQLCLNLDGIPMALELAAARSRSLSIEEINARLDNRFRLLTGGSRTALPRQQTLRALIDWSYDLLSDAEKMLLCRLSVFAGGWTLSAAEAVCGGGDLEDWDVLDLLMSLVDKSLVVAERFEQSQATRYRLLESIRQYASLRLDETEGESVRQRHRAFFTAFVEEAETHMKGADQPLWLNRLEIELDNVRAAQEVSGGNADPALRIAGGMARFCYVRGYLREGRERLRQALERSTAGGVPRAKALGGSGMLAYASGDYDAARAFFGESLAMYRDLDDSVGVAAQVGNLGIIASTTGDYARAREYQEESLALCRQIGDEHGIANALHNLGSVAHYRGDNVESKLRYEESLVLYRRLGNRAGTANALNNLSTISFDAGDYAAAQILLVECLSLRRLLGDRRRTVDTLDNFATIAMVQGRTDAAVHIWGSSSAARTMLGSGVTPKERVDLNESITKARAELGEEAFDAAWAEGGAMTTEQAVEYTLAHFN